MMKNSLQWWLIVSAVFLVTCKLNGQEKADSAGISIRNYINSFDASGATYETTGWYYFFTEKEKQDGWYLKMSYVEPGMARHGAHIHTNDEIIFILEGFAEININGQTQNIGPNTSVYFHAGSMHSLRNAGDTALKYLVIKKE